MAIIKISDEQWNKYLADEYQHVSHGMPRKEDIERYLNWLEIQKKK